MSAKTFLTGVAEAEGWTPATLLEVLFQYLDAERERCRDSYERLADFISERIAEDSFACGACGVSEAEGAESAECEECELCVVCCLHKVVDCLVCEREVGAEDAVSTYCGTMHAECFDEHVKTCAVCDEDAVYRAP